jgi:transposase
MNRAALHEGLRRMRFSTILDRHTGGQITQAEAAEMLGIGERTFRRWRDRFEEEGEAGLADRRLGRPSQKRAPAIEIERMLGLFRDKYADFTVKHFHEQLRKRHNYKLGYTVTKVHLHRAGLVRPAVKRPAHRKKRPRRPFVGMMLHQDGSRHAWLEGQAPMDLIVTLDDATGAIYSAFLVEEEGTASTFRGLREVVERHGLFCALYTDRGSHYFFTPKAGEKVSKTQLTQVGRALAHLGIEHIAAYSPEARGRSERAFRTLQDRLPKELRLAGIATVEAANAWLARTYITEHNRLFAIEPLEEGSAFVADTAGVWRETLCVVEERVVANDNTVAWAGRRLQIPPSRLRPHFVKASVRMHEYPDGTVSVFLGPHRLATFDALGAQIVSAPAAMSLAPCPEPSRPSPTGRAKSAALTAPVRGAFTDVRAGAEKRALSRTKKRPSGELHTASA